MFDFRDKAAKKSDMMADCLRYGREFYMDFLRKRIREEKFTMNPGETEDAAAKLCLEMYDDEIVRTSSHELSTVCTCTSCGNIIDKVLWSDGRQMVPGRACCCDRSEVGPQKSVKLTSGFNSSLATTVLSFLKKMYSISSFNKSVIKLPCSIADR